MFLDNDIHCVPARVSFRGETEPNVSTLFARCAAVSANTHVGWWAMSCCINRASADADQPPNLVEGTLANGRAFACNGDLLVANFGMDALEGMTRDGRCRIRLV